MPPAAVSHDEEGHAPDVYFTAGYGAAEEVAGQGRWLGLDHYDGRWQMPVHLRTADGQTDAVSPYGYAGIYCDPSISDRDANTAWRHARAALLDLGVPTVFLRQSPLVATRAPESPCTVVVADHRTVCLSTVDEDATWRTMAGRSRTSIRRAQREGYAARVRVAEPADVAPGSDFRRLYEEAMHRRSASARYFFPDVYYQRLLDMSGDGVLLVEVSRAAGPAVAAALLLRHGPLLHYHLSGADPQAGREGATNLAIWEAARHASDQGVERFHLGGGVTDGDGLHRFKAGFGGETLLYSAYGVVLDQARYESAVLARATTLGCTPSDLLAATAVFPAFRGNS